MATQVFLRNEVANTHRGTNTAKLNTSTAGWSPLGTATTRGSGLNAYGSNTVAGTTNGVEIETAAGSGIPVEWLSPPVDQDVTISGTITLNIWASESNMSANVAINAYVEKVAATDGALTRIATSTRTTELPVTTRTAQNFTVTPTSTALNKGDRLRIVLFGDDAGTMGSGFTFDVGVGGTTAAADGDTYVSFNETFGFQTSDPSATTLYLTDTASDIATSDIDYEAWTSRGDAAHQENSTPAVGWRAPHQATQSGTPMSWWSKPLQAFTLGGLVKCNIRARESAATANGSVGVEIARVDADGTNATVWGYANRDAATTSGGAGELATSETAYTVYVSGDDLSVSDGQRLRIRVFFEDCADIASAGGTVGMWFDGPTGGASGDTFLIFAQTLAEFSTTVNPPRVQTSILQAVNRSWTY